MIDGLIPMSPLMSKLRPVASSTAATNRGLYWLTSSAARKKPRAAISRTTRAAAVNSLSLGGIRNRVLLAADYRVHGGRVDRDSAQTRQNAPGSRRLAAKGGDARRVSREN